jgi:hypothetical protein
MQGIFVKSEINAVVNFHVRELIFLIFRKLNLERKFRN